MYYNVVLETLFQWFYEYWSVEMEIVFIIVTVKPSYVVVLEMGKIDLLLN